MAQLVACSQSEANDPLHGLRSRAQEVALPRSCSSLPRSCSGRGVGGSSGEGEGDSSSGG